MTILIFILILVCLILVHEFGHFIVAKAFGIRVDEFGIFFPPRLFAIKKGETEYSFNALPFGGFVRIFGEDGDIREPRSFTSKNRWIQASVIVAGIVFNLLLAWFLLTAGYMYGIETPVQHQGVGTVQNAQVTIVGVMPNSPAQKAGLRPGDKVTAVITGTSALPDPQSAEQVQGYIADHQNESVGFTVNRSGELVHALAKPAEGLAEGKKIVGVELEDVGILKLSLPLALVQGAVLGKNITVETARGLGGFFSQLVRGRANFEQVSGPIGITSIGSTAVKEGFISTIILTSLISINLAILNLLPIPGLDGGRLLFIAIEGVTKRPISKRISFAFTIAGFGLLILLMLVASYHDVVRLVHPAI